MRRTARAAYAKPHSQPCRDSQFILITPFECESVPIGSESGRATLLETSQKAGMGGPTTTLPGFCARLLRQVLFQVSTPTASIDHSSVDCTEHRK